MSFINLSHLKKWSLALTRPSVCQLSSFFASSQLSFTPGSKNHQDRLTIKLWTSEAKTQKKANCAQDHLSCHRIISIYIWKTFLLDPFGSWPPLAAVALQRTSPLGCPEPKLYSSAKTSQLKFFQAECVFKCFQRLELALGSKHLNIALFLRSPSCPRHPGTWSRRSTQVAPKGWRLGSKRFTTKVVESSKPQKSPVVDFNSPAVPFLAAGLVQILLAICFDGIGLQCFKLQVTRVNIITIQHPQTSRQTWIST